MKRVVCIVMALALLLSSCRISTGELSYDDAVETMDALLSKIKVVDESAYISSEAQAMANVSNMMPDVDKSYPLSVVGGAPLDLEIVSSTEKAVKDTASVKTDSWLLHMAENFNATNPTVNGRRASISIRPIASGTATDYVLTGEYVPKAFSPSNELWAEMIASKGYNITMVEKRLCGNTAGILMKPEAYKTMTDKYGEVTLENIYQAVIAGELTIGYTNPYSSSTGLNNLVSMLAAIEPSNPTGEEAAAKLSAFQAQIPSTSYTTAELISKATNGSLDCLSMEYQAYIYKKEFADYKFIPFGVRHDSPMYTIGTLTADESELLSQFIEYCKLPGNQQLATDNYGFNAYDSYAGVENKLSGEQLIAAQQVWKKTKDAGRPVVAVFVADQSGSMGGGPLAELKTSLKYASQYISSTNYIGLVAYSSDVHVLLPVAQFDTQQKNKFLNAIDYLTDGGNTATYNATLEGLKMLADAKEKIPNAKLMLFVLSDGESSTGANYYTMEKIRPVIVGLGFPIHTLGYNVSNDELKELASINEASYVGTNVNDIIYQLKNIFNAQM